MKKLYILALVLLPGLLAAAGDDERVRQEKSAQANTVQGDEAVQQSLLKTDGARRNQRRVQWDYLPPLAIKFYKTKLFGQKSQEDEESDDAPALVREAKQDYHFSPGGKGNGWRSAPPQADQTVVDTDRRRVLQGARGDFSLNIVKNYHSRMGELLMYADWFVWVLERPTLVGQLQALLTRKEVTDSLYYLQHNRSAEDYQALKDGFQGLSQTITANKTTLDGRARHFALNPTAEQAREAARLAKVIRQSLPSFMKGLVPSLVEAERGVRRAEQSLTEALGLYRQQPSQALDDLCGARFTEVAARVDVLRSLIDGSAAMEQLYRDILEKFLRLYKNFWDRIELLYDGEAAADFVLGLGYESLSAFERAFSTARARQFAADRGPDCLSEGFCRLAETKVVAKPWASEAEPLSTGGW